MRRLRSSSAADKTSDHRHALILHACHVGAKMKLMNFSSLTVCACLFVSACGGGDAPEVPIASAQVMSGDGQTVEVATELPQALVVRLVNANGVPLRGKSVNFVVTAGGGSVFAGAANSDADGFAREHWTLGTAAGVQTVEMRALDTAGATVVYATFGATALAGLTTSIVAVEGDNQSGQQGQTLPITVRVRTADQYGNPTRRVMVTLEAQDGGSSELLHQTTGDDGMAAAGWTLGPTLGAQHLVATATPIAHPEISILLTATANP